MIAQARAEGIAAVETREADFEGLVREHQSMVYSLAWNSLQDHALAEEIAQEVFLELYRRMSAFDSPAHLKNWLRKVTLNRCIDQTRRCKLRPRVGLEDAPEPATPASEPDLLAEERVRRLVASLPAALREVVILRFQEDLAPEEIAEAMKLTSGRVKRLLRRALELLRVKLEACEERGSR